MKFITAVDLLILREPADTCGLQAAEPGDVLHGRKDGGACLDVPQGMEGSAVEPLCYSHLNKVDILLSCYRNFIL